MRHGTTIISKLYKKLLGFYPQEFKEQLGESMEQKFHDLYNEQKRGPARGFVVLPLLTEKAIGIAQEHLLLLMEGDVMKTILAKHGQPSPA